MSVVPRTPKLLTAACVAVLLSVAGAGLAAPASGATTAPAAEQSARLPGFNATGVYDIYQSNATVRVDFSQNAEGRLFGSVRSGNTVGNVREGSVDGQQIYFVIAWSHGPVGRYTGKRGPDGRLSGTTYDLTNPSSQATWRTEQRF
ncbi:hypothetical protein OOK31_17605 [Streptomyces sp. NBC_00249]|uniref:hypothetical protein n=1 Tax=Streptomyces sp. NBC_00249 TaxID=2975690 RepID=UPI002257A33B|nr:hypothetical protein [Streptomyces sp. NBC_00249]MCX5195698.1 hypothetical protein [Streptomyces sp. NBC_00249]